MLGRDQTWSDRNQAPWFALAGAREREVQVEFHAARETHDIEPLASPGGATLSPERQQRVDAIEHAIGPRPDRLERSKNRHMHGDDRRTSGACGDAQCVVDRVPETLHIAGLQTWQVEALRRMSGA